MVPFQWQGAPSQQGPFAEHVRTTEALGRRAGGPSVCGPLHFLLQGGFPRETVRACVLFSLWPGERGLPSRSSHGNGGGTWGCSREGPRKAWLQCEAFVWKLQGAVAGLRAGHREQNGGRRTGGGERYIWSQTFLKIQSTVTGNPPHSFWGLLASRHPTASSNLQGLFGALPCPSQPAMP